MAGLAEKLAAAPRRLSNQTCHVGAVLQRVDDVDRAALEAALVDSGLTGVQIAELLQGEGFAVKSHSVQRHRNRMCDCG